MSINKTLIKFQNNYKKFFEYLSQIESYIFNSNKKEIKNKKRQGYYRKRLVIESPQDVYIKLDNKKVINFTSNDYLGLANNKLIKKAFIMGA